MAKPLPGGRNIGVTRARAFRVSDELWEACVQKAAAERPNGERGALSEVIREFLLEYAKEPIPGYTPPENLKAMDSLG